MSPFKMPQVALSLTPPDTGLLEYSSLLARLFAWANIDFAHVAVPDESLAGFDPQPWQARMRQEVERHFGRPAQECQLRYHAVQGMRIDQLLHLASVHSRDVVVMGHRRSRSGRRSLARRVAMIAPASVWLVPEGAAPQIKTILVPTDFSRHSADALRVAAKIAVAAGIAKMCSVHVFFDPSTVRYDEHVAEVVGNEETAFAEFLAKVDTEGVHVEPVIQEGTHTAQDILRVAERLGTDLIVMNTRGRSNAASVLLGSVTSDTMASTQVPLLAVKHYGARMTLMQALMNHHLWEQDSPKTN
jgi:nucleotide-binding universal stress UspA family protein